MRECSAAPRSVTYLLTQQPGDGDMAPRPPRLGILQLGTPGHCNVLWQQTDDWQCCIVTLWTDLASVSWSEAGEERVVSLVVVTCLVSSLLQMVTKWSLRSWSPLVCCQASALHYFCSLLLTPEQNLSPVLISQQSEGLSTILLLSERNCWD